MDYQFSTLYSPRLSPKRVYGLALGVIFLAFTAVSNMAYARDVDLRVLVIATATPKADNTPSGDVALDLIRDVLDNIGVRYTVLDATQTTLTASMLSSGTHGNYNGIILTDSQLSFYIPNVGYQSALSLAEWQLLHSYEQTFGIREAVMSGWPAVDPSLDLDYGLQYVSSVSSASPVNARWVTPVGGTEFFEYVNNANPLVVNDWSYVTRSSASTAVPTVTPLLTVNGDPNQILVAHLRYANGREVLFSSIANASYLIHSKILAYEFINYATKGVFLGARQVALAAHVDDVFLSTELWDPVNNTTPEGGIAARMTNTDVTATMAAQAALRSQHSAVASAFTLDMVFNGEGSTTSDPLTLAIQANKSKLRFINHTYSHFDMELATYDDAAFEITENIAVWNDLALPKPSQSQITLVTGKHSGLHTATQPFPTGMNLEMFDAARDAGIRYLASDSSQPGENVERYAPGYSTIVMLPRRPSAVFYNISTPAGWVDEYNYIFRERYIEAGQDPCTIPGAICSPRDFNQILAAEADLALRQLLEFRLWPYFMHQANLKNYDGNGKTLLFDWLNAVVNRYKTNLKLPLKSYPYYTIGGYTKNRIDARTATIIANWNLDTNQVTLNSTNKTARVWVTGLSGGTLYGGQRQRYLTLSRNVNNVYAVDRALTQ